MVSPAGYRNALFVNSGATYTLSGGQLSAPNEWVSYYSPSYFVQTGGTNSAASLIVGAYTNATYTLSGGLLSAGILEVGALGTPNRSTITQSGGSNLVTTMYLGYGSPAYYYLTPGTSGGGGLLSAQTEYLGISNGSGYFSQSAGTNSATFLYAGYNGGEGTYVLSGSGLLSAAYRIRRLQQLIQQHDVTSRAGPTRSLSTCLWETTPATAARTTSAAAAWPSPRALNGAEYIGYDGTGVIHADRRDSYRRRAALSGVQRRRQRNVQPGRGQPFRRQRIRRLFRQRHVHPDGRNAYGGHGLAQLLVLVRGLQRRQQRDLQPRRRQPVVRGTGDHRRQRQRVLLAVGRIQHRRANRSRVGGRQQWIVLLD